MLSDSFVLFLNCKEQKHVYVPFKESAMSWPELYFSQPFCTTEWILVMYEFGIREFCLASPKYASSDTEV